MRKTSKIIITTVVLAMLLLGVGYAALQNITLNIRGTATADPSQSNFKVAFTGESTVSDSNYVTTSVEDGATSATINVKNLTTKGQTATATYTIKNSSTDMSADLAVSTTNTNTNYFTLRSDLAKTSLTAGESTTVTVLVELTKTPVSTSESATIEVYIVATPVEPGQEGTSGSTNGSSQTPSGSGPVSITNTDDIFAFDASTGTITGIKSEYMKETETGYYTDVYYINENNSTTLNYKNNYGGCVLVEDIDTLVVPSSINGIAVKNVNYIGALNVKRLVFESGITNISGCYNLAKMYNENTIDTYTSEELENVNSLEEIILPNTLTNIGDSAFSGCTKLKYIAIPQSTENISYYSFLGCSSMRDVMFGGGFESTTFTIGDYAFYGCYNLQTVHMYNSSNWGRYISVGAHNEPINNAQKANKDNIDYYINYYSDFEAYN